MKRKMEITDPPENRVSIKILVPRFGWSSHARDFSADCTFKEVLETFTDEAQQLIGINLLRGDVVFEDTTVRPTRNLTEEFGGHDEVICRSLHQLELWSSVSVSMLISGDRGEDTTVANNTSSADELRNDIKQASASHSSASSPSSIPLPLALDQGENYGADDQRDKNACSAPSERLITITVIPVHEASRSFKLRPFRCLDTVGLVKARAAAASLRDGSLALAPAESLQLVFRGNVLSDDDATLAAVGIGNSVGGSGGVTLIGVRQRRQEEKEESDEQPRNEEEAQEAQEQQPATRLEYEHEEPGEVPVRRAEGRPSQSRPSTTETARRRAGPHDICRICLEGVAAGPLITPCLCAGTINFIHADCLAQWRATQRGEAATKCGTCGYIYRVERTRWASFLLSDHGAYVLTAVVVVLLVYLSASCAAILWRLLGACIPGAATRARGAAVAVMRRLRAIPHHHQPLVQLHDIMMQIPEEGARERAELSAPFPPLWPLWRPTLPSVFWLGRRPIMLQNNLPVWLWGALQAHVDFLMGGLYVLGAVGFACYIIQELLGNLLPPILYLWYYNRQRLQHGQRNDDVNDYQDHRRNEGGAAALERQRGEGHPTAGTPYFVSLSGRWYRAAVSAAAAVLRRLWVIASFPWNGLVIPADFRRYLNPNFAVLVAWFVSFYQNSSGGAFTRLVICIGVPLVSRSAVVYYALPHGRRVAQRLGERMLEIHEN